MPPSHKTVMSAEVIQKIRELQNQYDEQHQAELVDEREKIDAERKEELNRIEVRWKEEDNKIALQRHQKKQTWILDEV